MPKRDPDLLIEDILTAIGKIERYTTGMKQAQVIAYDLPSLRLQLDRLR
jgi:uncharacterized protein with HEPN domain